MCQTCISYSSSAEVGSALQGWEGNRTFLNVTFFIVLCSRQRHLRGHRKKREARIGRSLSTALCQAYGRTQVLNFLLLSSPGLVEE